MKKTNKKSKIKNTKSSTKIPYDINKNELNAEDGYVGRECYVFNLKLKKEFDDLRCEHCMYYLTTKCKYIEEFLDEMEDLEVE